MIQLLNIDCMEYMATVPDKHFDLAIVDPPYGINVNMNMGKKKGEKPRYEKKKWDISPPQSYFNELFRVSKNQIIWGGNYFTDKIPLSMGWIFWDKDVPNGVSFSDGELAWTSYNIALKKFFIPYCGFIGMDNKRIHPTEKPVKLYNKILSTYANTTDKILDTHLGSGSSAIAAHYFGCDFVGCEIDKEYFEAAQKRFKQLTAQTTLL